MIQELKALSEADPDEALAWAVDRSRNSVGGAGVELVYERTMSCSGW